MKRNFHNRSLKEVQVQKQAWKYKYNKAFPTIEQAPYSMTKQDYLFSFVYKILTPA